MEMVADKLESCRLLPLQLKLNKADGIDAFHDDSFSANQLDEMLPTFQWHEAAVEQSDGLKIQQFARICTRIVHPLSRLIHRVWNRVVGPTEAVYTLVGKLCVISSALY